MKAVLNLILILFSVSFFAQQPTDAALIQEALLQKTTLANNSLVKNINFTNIGPTIMSGRVADVAVNPENTTEFYVGYASGGLWYTNNNGTTFTTQLIGVISVTIFTFIFSYIVFFLLKQFIGLRISDEAEKLGTDVAEIGVRAYAIRD